MTPFDEAPKLAPFTLRGHNPDVLNTIANLSNDEVFTPPELANEMLDMLEKSWAEGNNGANIWSDHTVTFLDPFTKSGVFLREITARLVKGLEEWMPDLQQRVNHILTKQVFGIGITQLTSLLARRSVYCSKTATGKHSIVKSFDRDWGNIWFERTEHTWVGGTDKVITMDENGNTVLKATNGRCKYCGASQKEYERSDALESHAYAFIHTDDIKARMAELFGANMHFDVVIGNPPYQMSTGGGTATQQARPLYHQFVESAQGLEPRYIAMVTPSRWFVGGMNLNEFREQMLNDSRLRVLVDFPDSRDAFGGVDIAGGVSYFLWERSYDGTCSVTTVKGSESHGPRERKLNEFDVFVRDNDAAQILSRIVTREDFKSLSSIVSAISPFGLSTAFRGDETAEHISDPIIVRSTVGRQFANRNVVLKNVELLDQWKVLLSATASEHAGQAAKDGRKRVFSRIETAEPGVAMTHSYLAIGPLEDSNQCKNLEGYLRTKFTRFLASLGIITQHISKASFAFVPTQDFSRPWVDEDLYKAYGLTPEEVQFIESQIKDMGDING